MAPLTFSGVYTALATPLSGDGLEVDLGTLTAAVERQVAAGVAGLVPCGSTGEFFALSADERRAIVEACVQAADGRVDVVPQTGALTTAAAVALSRHAAANGCAAVLAMPPFFAPSSREELRRYYDALVQAIDVPVIYYHNPLATGQALNAAEIVELCASVGIRHVKFTSPDVATMIALLFEYGDAVQTLPAWDVLTLTAFLSGARCSIWGAAAAVPDLCVELLTAATGTDLPTALDVWRRAAPLFAGIGSLGYIAAVKAASALLGHPMGPPRPPLTPLDADARAGLAALLQRAGYTTVG